jgi:AcrR family transcriptional regulator
MPRLTKQERREQIIISAATVFAECGLSGARTKDIAHACGINEALLYKHFASKEELFYEALGYVHSKLIQEWKAVVQNQPDTITALRKLVNWQTDMMFDNPMMCANMLHALTASTNNTKMREIVAGWLRDHQEFMCGLFKKGIDDGSVRADGIPEHLAFTIRGLTWLAIISISTGVEDQITRETVRKAFFDSIGQMVPI